MNKFVSDEDFDLWLLILQARRAMLKARRRELAEYKLSPRHSVVLFAIKLLGEKATPAEISMILLREPHSVSEILIKMEQEGLVRKSNDLPRKNQVRLELTDKGHEAYSQAAKRESVHKIMSSLSKEQYKQLKSILKILRDAALKEVGEKRELLFPLL